ncbi:MAG: toll/interleukin-1 receptor domain-containing protein, partial [Merismopedia sp. SIO2A8]|nr:toll/interleukin-1 receptor domain-containing protein [Merismopedia sp. SIO2A8]
MPEPVKVFLSYVESDRDIVSKLYTDLKNAGFSPWMADKDLFPGEVLRDGINKAMKNANALLFCLPEQISYDDLRKLTEQIQSGLQLSSDEVLTIPIFSKAGKTALFSQIDASIISKIEEMDQSE